MPTLSYSQPIVIGQPEDFNKVNTSLTEIKNVVNALDDANIAAGANVQGSKLQDSSIATAKLSADAVTNDKLDSTTVNVPLGLNETGVVRRGKSIIATSESRTNVAFGTLTTPDQVANLVLPTDGLIAVVYQATWQESVAQAARAAIFIGSNQLVAARDAVVAGPVTQAAQTGSGTTAIDRPLFSGGGGLFGANGGNTSIGADATTGQLVGAVGGNAAVAFQEIGGGLAATYLAPGACYIFAAAGTYTVSVRFNASSGSVTVKNRKLWAWTLGF